MHKQWLLIFYRSTISTETIMNDMVRHWRTQIAVWNHFFKEISLLRTKSKSWAKHARNVVSDVSSNINSNLVDQSGRSHWKSDCLGPWIHLLWTNTLLESAMKKDNSIQYTDLWYCPFSLCKALTDKHNTQPKTTYNPSHVTTDVRQQKGQLTWRSLKTSEKKAARQRVVKNPGPSLTTMTIFPCFNPISTADAAKEDTKKCHLHISWQ